MTTVLVAFIVVDWRANDLHYARVTWPASFDYKQTAAAKIKRALCRWTELFSRALESGGDSSYSAAVLVSRSSGTHKSAHRYVTRVARNKKAARR
jgi:hypothetical protein